MEAARCSLRQELSSRKRVLALLGVLALLAVALRCWGLNRPFLGAFGSKAAVHGMIARNWSASRAPWHLPTVDMLAGSKRGLHLLEYPVPTALVAWGHRLLGGPLELWGRGQALLWSLAGLVFLFLGVRHRWGEQAAWGAAAAWVLSPVGVIYGQHFLVEVPAVAWLLGCWWLWPQALRPRAWLARMGTCLLLAAALLTRPMLVVLLPWLVAEAWRLPSGKERRDGLARSGTLVAVALVPLGVWVAWVFHVASPGGPLAQRVYYSLVQSSAAQQHAWTLLLEPSWYARVAKELSLRVLGPLGLMLAVWGLWRGPFCRQVWLPCGLSLGLLLLLPGKFYQQNYYYVLLLPAGCIACGLGWQAAEAWLRRRRWQLAALGGLWLAGTLRLAWPAAYTTPEEDRPVLQVAATVQQLTLPEEPVVALHGGSAVLLFYCDRPGWAWTDDSRRLPRRLQLAQEHGARVVAWVGRRVPSVLAVKKFQKMAATTGGSFGSHSSPLAPAAQWLIATWRQPSSHDGPVGERLVEQGRLEHQRPLRRTKSRVPVTPAGFRAAE